MLSRRVLAIVADGGSLRAHTHFGLSLRRAGGCGKGLWNCAFQPRGAHLYCGPLNQPFSSLSLSVHVGDGPSNSTSCCLCE